MTYDAWKTTEAPDAYREDPPECGTCGRLERDCVCPPVTTDSFRAWQARNGLPTTTLKDGREVSDAPKERNDVELARYVCPDCESWANECVCPPVSWAGEDHDHDSHKEG